MNPPKFSCITCCFDVDWILLSQAGVAGAVIADDAVVGIVTATTSQRFKDLKDQLEITCDSFRAYPVKDPNFATNTNTFKMAA